MVGLSNGTLEIECLCFLVPSTRNFLAFGAFGVFTLLCTANVTFPCSAVATEGSGGQGAPPPYFDKSVNAVSTSGTDYAQHMINTRPSPWVFRPSFGPVLSTWFSFADQKCRFSKSYYSIGMSTNINIWTMLLGDFHK